LTVFFAPQAAGSGVPELIGFLNGVDNQKYLRPIVFIVKALGVTLAVAGTLIVGREGPLAHIGAAVASFVLFMPFKYLE
jgi:chloride channel 7